MTVDEAIHILECGGWWDILDPSGSDADLDPLHEALDVALAALRAQQNGGWISVKDRLPEEHGEYLTLCKTPNGDFTVKLSTLFPYEGNLYWSDYAMERVAYWQPLPEPPKGE